MTEWDGRRWSLGGAATARTWRLEKRNGDSLADTGTDTDTDTDRFHTCEFHLAPCYLRCCTEQAQRCEVWCSFLNRRRASVKPGPPGCLGLGSSASVCCVSLSLSARYTFRSKPSLRRSMLDSLSLQSQPTRAPLRRPAAQLLNQTVIADGQSLEGLRERYSRWQTPHLA